MRGVDVSDEAGRWCEFEVDADARGTAICTDCWESIRGECSVGSVPAVVCVGAAVVSVDAAVVEGIRLYWPSAHG